MNQNITVAIQGETGSYHDLAARKYFNSDRLEITECKTFKQVCERVMNGGTAYGIMAIENSLAGSLLPNYALLQEYPLFIRGEEYVRIEHHLMALPGQLIPDIHVVRSHPMALMQCSEFLEKYPEIQQVETDDTAGSARQISLHKERGIAAIASAQVAEIFNLQILARGIENLKQNYTRFFIVSKKKKNQTSDGNKASLNFRISHQVGSLASILNIFTDHRLNLTLIQSIPVPGQPDEYRFHVDVEWQHAADFQSGLEEVQQKIQELTVLGVYRKARRTVKV